MTLVAEIVSFDKVVAEMGQHYQVQWRSPILCCLPLQMVVSEERQLKYFIAGIRRCEYGAETLLSPAPTDKLPLMLGDVGATL